MTSEQERPPAPDSSPDGSSGDVAPGAGPAGEPGAAGEPGSAGEPGLGGPVVPVLTVAAVARRLGVAPSTLRTWDRRYGLGPSAHTAGSHRRYGPDDLRRLSAMRSLVLEGVPPAEAALIAKSDLGPLPDPDPADRGRVGWAPTPAVDLDEPDDAVAVSGAEGAPHPAPSPTGGIGYGPAVNGGEIDADPRFRGIVRAADALDPAELTRLTREALGAHGVVGAWERVITPALRSLGDRWSASGAGVEAEHVLSEVLLATFRGVVANLYRARNASPVLLVCADGDHHTLPLHAVAAALAEHEIGTRMLGVGLPWPALVSAVRRTGPAAVMIYARLPVVEASGLGELSRQRPAPRVLVGGSGWSGLALPPTATPVRSLAETVAAVRDVVRL